jgi:Replicase family/Primase C terminal 1 (PriCT-1)
MNQILQDFYDHLNESVVTTNDFEYGTRFRKREKVGDFAYCGLNQMYRHYLSFDIDQPDSAFFYQDVGLPPPTIITVNPVNSHCHYLYKLNTPVAFHDGGRSSPQDFFKGIERAMTDCLVADLAYNHVITKNPLHSRWHVITNPASYDLSVIGEYLPDKPTTHPHRKGTDQDIRGRNDKLFHTMRHWAYRAVQQFTGEEIWLQAIQFKATEINAGFADPLPYKEVQHSAKACGRWAWKNRHKFGSRPKVLNFTTETPQERMSKGAEYTNAIRAEKAIQTLQNTAVALRSSGTLVTPLALQAASGLNIKTVRKYMGHIRH